MAVVLKDRVRGWTNAAGEDAFNISADAAGYQAFSVIGDGNQTYYTCFDPNTGAWEVGIGTYTAATNSLSRDTILSSSNSNAKVLFLPNQKELFVGYPAERAVATDLPATLTNKTIQSSTLDSSPVGSVTPSTGAFTTLTATAASMTSANMAVALVTTGTVTNLTATSASIASANIGTAVISSFVIEGISVNSANFNYAKITDLVATGASIASANATNLQVTGASIASANVGVALITTGTVTNLTATGASIASANLGNAVITSMTITGASVASVNAGVAVVTDLRVVGASITSANVGNLQVTGASVASMNAGVALITTGTVTNLTATGASIASANVGTAVITGLTVTNASVASLNAGTATITTGNLAFSGTAQRITGDFTNATIANRVIFQTSTTNGGTTLVAIPNGASTTAQLQLQNSSSDLVNHSYGLVRIDNSSFNLRSEINGTGSYLPLTFYTGGSERMRIDSSGRAFVGTTSTDLCNGNVQGIGLGTSQNGTATVGASQFSCSSNAGINVNRKTDDGNLVTFYQDGSLEGTISVAGNTVSYNAFAGSHWSQLQNGSKPDILRGTVMESINELCVWPGEQNERLPKSKVSDTAGSKKVYGVFMAWDNDWTTTNDMLVTSVGAFICRVNNSVTVQEGDLLESNGDGTARVQADDIIRTSTIGKVTSTVKTHQYADGSYCVPTVLYCG